jgi:hypothetical protein
MRRSPVLRNRGYRWWDHAMTLETRIAVIEVRPDSGERLA